MKLISNNDDYKMDSILLKDLCKEFRCEVKTDNSYQKVFRILQSFWRDSKGYAMGPRSSKNPELLGSKLPIEFAEKTLANYLTDSIKSVVRRELEEGKKSEKLFSKPRIYNDLLSSQPLCFNLFAELQSDLQLATEVFRDLSSGVVKEVISIKFEHSPGRLDSRHTGDRSAFDVYVEYKMSDDKKGFFGIEVKYHEDLVGKPASLKERYMEITQDSNCFKDNHLHELKVMPLQQLWRDHLLALSHKKTDDNFQEGIFVLLYPKDNHRCASVAHNYRNTLTNSSTFQQWTMETVVSTIKKYTKDQWILDFEDRYLNIEKIIKAIRNFPNHRSQTES